MGKGCKCGKYFCLIDIWYNVERIVNILEGRNSI